MQEIAGEDAPLPNSTDTSYDSYASSLPAAAYQLLELQLDWDNNLDRDLRQIAHCMLEWDTKLSTHLKLTEVDIHDIKEEYKQQPELQR